MTEALGPFRCATASTERDEPLAGTASTVTAYLLVENPGPWGVEALRDSRLPTSVRAGLAAAAKDAGVRVLMIRRHHRRAPREGFAVFAAYADPHAPRAERGRLEHAEDLLALDLAALGSGHSAGLTPHHEPLYCVCTHGKHDACCAELGRPVAAALTAARPAATWECSHIGGDRFAGNALVLPDGLYYGRLDVGSAVAVAGTHEAGHLDLAHLRGRSGYAMPVQAAELALRRELGETERTALRLVAQRRDGERTVATFAVAGTAGSGGAGGSGGSGGPGGAGRRAPSTYDVEVRSERGAAEQLTCSALRQNPVPRHTLVEISEVPSRSAASG